MRIRAALARRPDVAIGAAIGVAAAVVFAVTFHPDWIYDPLRYAELTQRGPERILLGPQHALGNVLPLAAYRAARGLGYGGHAMPVLAAFSVAGAAVAVGAVYLAAARLGGTRAAAAGAAGVFAATVVAWRAGGSGGVYGVALAASALAWVAVAAYLRAPADRTVAVLGAAAGAAIASHLENVAVLAAALVVIVRVERGSARWRRLGIAVGSAAAATAVVFVVAAGVATGWSAGGMWRWIAQPGIGGPFDRSSAVGWGGAGLFQAIARDQRAIAAVVLAVAAARVLTLAIRSGPGRILALAVAANAATAFALASWYQALRPDYWGLGLVPLAVGAGAGTRAFGRRTRAIRAAAVVVSLGAVGGLAAWNAAHEVAPSLRRSHANARTVDAVEGRLPGDAHVVASLFLAGRLADDGFRAEPGFAAILHGHLEPGTYVTSDAFDLTAAQVRALGSRHPAAELRVRWIGRVDSIRLGIVLP